VTRSSEFDHRFGAALVLSLVIHLGAMTLSPSSPKAPSFNPPVPLSVQLVQEPVPQVAELARPARPPATKPARARPAPPKHEEAPVALTTPAQARPPVETIQAAPAIDEAPASPSEPAVPPPITASLPSTPEPVVLPAPAQRAPSAEALARYAKSLSETFARYKEYPRIAELRRWEGSVTMRLRVAPSGRLIAAELYESSGYEALDKQAMTMVTRAGVLPVPPEGLDAAGVPVLVPINFRLER
jgi:periplasmic protein TonB